MPATTGIAAPATISAYFSRLKHVGFVRLRELLFAALPKIGLQPTDARATALGGAPLLAVLGEANTGLVIHNRPRRGDSALQFVMGRDRRTDGLLR